MTSAPGEADVDAELAVDDLVEEFVAAVCRPGDIPVVLDTVQRVDPVDLAGLVAAVDDHQPMTLEVVVDVLAELGVPPTVIAGAVGVDAADVQVLLGPPSVLPRPSRVGLPARVIDVSDDRPGDPLPASAEHTGGGRDASVAAAAADTERREDRAMETVGDAVDDRDDAVVAAADRAATAEVDDVTDGRDAATTDGLDATARESATPVVRIAPDDVPDDRSAASPVTDPSSRARVWFAVVLFVLLVGGAVALAWLVGAF